MKKIIHPANTRGEANHGWLYAKHSFSFANFYNSEKMNFGALRVLNDDLIAPGMGFGTHPHENMEIITIPLSGHLKHKDSIEINWKEVNAGEVQVMSAGKGIQHSEINGSKTEYLSLFQIWILPNKKNIKGSKRYQALIALQELNSFINDKVGEIPSQLIKSIEIIVSKYRNPSAHIGEISKSDADMFLEEYKKLMNGLFKSFSKIKP